MLTRLAEVLATLTDDQLLQNALIESCAIHARALVQFLFTRQAESKLRSDDAIAEDFLDVPDEWQHALPSLPRELDRDNLSIFVNKQIAHITYTESLGDHPINKGHHDWDFAAVTDVIQPTLEEFISRVSRDKLGDYWYDLVEHQPGSRWDKLIQLIRDKNA